MSRRKESTKRVSRHPEILGVRHGMTIYGFIKGTTTAAAVMELLQLSHRDTHLGAVHFDVFGTRMLVGFCYIVAQQRYEYRVRLYEDSTSEHLSGWFHAEQAQELFDTMLRLANHASQ